MSPGHIAFHPIVGIVGSREIDVDVTATGSLSLSRFSRMRPLVTVITLVTPAGHLEWAVDTDQLDWVAKLLAGKSVA